MTFRLTPPPAVLAPLVREAPSRLDPFRLDGPALVSFSGGRTSAYMLRRILDACGGRLPAGVHAVFANTGRERAETLRFVADNGQPLKSLLKQHINAQTELCK